MKPSSLFLQRCEQIALLLESGREIELLDVAARLRQLFLDSHPLAVTVNTNHLKLHFQVGEFPPHIHPNANDLVLFSLEDAVDPETQDPSRPRLKLSFKRFLAHPVMTIRGQLIPIKHLIRHLANVSGGVHHDPSSDEQYLALVAFSQWLRVGGLPFGTRIMRAIGRVSLRGLQPLIDDVKAR